MRNFTQTWKAVCSDCKKECEVPFQPDLNKPVYCKICWLIRKQSKEKIIKPDVYI